MEVYSNEDDKKSFYSVADADTDIFPTKIYYALKTARNVVIRYKNGKVFHIEKDPNPPPIYKFLINDQK